MSAPMLIAPTEPTLLKQLGRVSSFPERLGADVAWPVAGRWVGLQRKTWADLWASLQDGRLQKELGQLQQCTWRGLLVEGLMAWTETGASRDPYLRLSQAQWEGLQASVQWRYGGLVVQTTSLEDTVRRIVQLAEWLVKPQNGLARRPPSPEQWGTKSNQEWGSYVLQSFPGIGPTLALAIYTRYGVPMQWTVGAEELAQVPGIGRVRAQRLIRALMDRNATPERGQGS